MEMESHGQRFNHSCLLNETPIKSPTPKLRGASLVGSTQRIVTQGHARKIACPWGRHLNAPLPLF